MDKWPPRLRVCVHVRVIAVCEWEGGKRERERGGERGGGDQTTDVLAGCHFLSRG